VCVAVECGRFLEFRGMRIGLSSKEPARSPDGIRACLPAHIADPTPLFLRRMGAKVALPS